LTQQKAIDYGLLWLRVAVGCAVLFLHGFGRVPRVYHYLLGQPWSFVALVAKIGFPIPPFFALASALSEFIGGTLLIIGLFTRPSALWLAINLGVAMCFEFSKSSGGEPELPGIYFIALCAILIAGSGPYSLDELRRRRRERAPVDRARTAVG
jgi:putative oxidoreductase